MSKPEVLVVTGNQGDGHYLSGLLGAMDYAAKVIPSLEDLQTTLQQDPHVVVIIDLDTLRADKQFFRSLRKSQPRLHTLGISSLAYHPGLEEVIGTFYACLVKPLDVDELRYWLKTIEDNLAELDSQPEREVGP